MHSPIINQPSAAKQALRATCNSAIAAYLASGRAIRVYKRGAIALPISAINAAIYSGKKPRIYCIHTAIAHITN